MAFATRFEKGGRQGIQGRPTADRTGDEFRLSWAVNLNLKHSLRVMQLLLRFPSTIPRLIEGLWWSRIAHRRVLGLESYIGRRVVDTYVNNPVHAKRIHGFEIFLNPHAEYISPLIAVAGIWELATTDLFIELLRKGGRVVDVGANVGWFTLLAASRVGQDGTVLSFEPAPANFSLLAKSVERNKFRNVRLFNEIVSDIDGTRTLYLARRAQETGLHSIVRSHGGEELAISSVRLDTMARSLGNHRIDVLKVDVEGAEPEVLLGAEGLISQRKIRNMVLEWNPEVWPRNRRLLDELLSLYEFYRIRRLSPFVLQKLKDGSFPSSQANIYLKLV